jgi:hypothetical protein
MLLATSSAQSRLVTQPRRRPLDPPCDRPGPRQLDSLGRRCQQPRTQPFRTLCIELIVLPLRDRRAVVHDGPLYGKQSRI